ncbi:acyltransferase [Paenibacillus filicis]|uniref:Acyltransferase n=1 Tax=Paenibacillus filicis TaxID=669464 RepID=A0ABU9DWL7_9BACL
MKSTNQLAPIQSARGVAVLLVALFHTSQMGERYYQYNFLGVSGLGKSGAYTFFFVLTGYLMYTIYHGRFTRHEEAGRFLLKRFIRIYPLYWLLMFVLTPVYFLFPSFGLGHERQPGVILKSMLLWPQGVPPVMGVAWSLSYVVFFYLVFSLFFVLKEKSAAALFSSWFTVILLNAFGLIHVKEQVLLQFLFNPVHLEFFCGMLVGYAVQRKLIRGWSGWWLLIGVAAYPLLWLLFLRTPGLPYTDLLYMAASSVLLAGITRLQATGSRYMKPLVALGDASYSILLTSLPFLSIVDKLFRGTGVPEQIGRPAAIGLSLVAAVLLGLSFYRLVEKPLNVRLRSLVGRKQAEEAEGADYTSEKAGFR